MPHPKLQAGCSMLNITQVLVAMAPLAGITCEHFVHEMLAHIDRLEQPVRRREYGRWKWYSYFTRILM